MKNKRVLQKPSGHSTGRFLSRMMCGDMFKNLSSAQRRLLTSFFLFGLATPMVVVYANTFLWRQTQDLLTLAIFNIGNYIGITLGFLFNARLLRIFESGRLYAFGCVLQGIVPIVLVALGAQANTYVLPLGIVLGIAQGFFWSNRNALTSKVTQGPHRYQFISTETAFSIIAGIGSPLLIGWFIAFGETLPSYTVEQAYQITSVLGFLLLVGAGMLAWNYIVEPFADKVFFVKPASTRWNLQRLLEGVNGIASGIESILPLVIILLFLGQEEAVGTVKALASALSAVVIFLLSRRVRHNHHTALFSIWLLFNFVGAAIFFWWYSPLSALVFFVLNGLVASLRWSSLITVMYELVDREIEHDGSHRFVYLIDRELFLNAGRVAGIALLAWFYTLNPAMTLRSGLVLMILIQIPAVFMLKHISDSVHRH